VIVLIGSPMCPSCLSEVSAVLQEESRHPDWKLRYVFAPKEGGNDEIQLALRLKAVLGAKNGKALEKFCPGADPKTQLAATEAFEGREPTANTLLARECEHDELLVKRLQV
jgi:hypothetical protein